MEATANTHAIKLSPELAELSDRRLGHGTAPRIVALEREEPALRRVEPALEREELARESVTGAQRYKVQFTATAEYAERVERAQALLSGSEHGAALAELHLRAMRDLVNALERRKYGAGARPRSPVPASTNAPQPPRRPQDETEEAREAGEASGKDELGKDELGKDELGKVPPAPNTPRQRAELTTRSPLNKISGGKSSTRGGGRKHALKAHRSCFSSAWH